MTNNRNPQKNGKLLSFVKDHPWKTAAIVGVTALGLLIIAGGIVLIATSPATFGGGAAVGAPLLGVGGSLVAGTVLIAAGLVVTGCAGAYTWGAFKNWRIQRKLNKVGTTLLSDNEIKVNDEPEDKATKSFRSVSFTPGTKVDHGTDSTLMVILDKPTKEKGKKKTSRASSAPVRPFSERGKSRNMISKSSETGEKRKFYHLFNRKKAKQNKDESEGEGTEMTEMEGRKKEQHHH